MSGFIDKVRQKMLEKKKKAMIRALKEKQGNSSYNSGTGKKVISSTETLTLSSKTNELIKSVKEEVIAINTAADFNTEFLLKYIEDNGTKVFRISNATSLLNKVNEHTGFITPLEGAKAAYINTITGSGLKAGTEAMFIIDSDKEIDYYMLLREFYLWISYKKNLGGFDFKTQEIFKKYMLEKNNPAMSKLNYDTMCELQEALARDSEANEFVIEIVKQKDGSANVLKKIQEGGADI